MTRPTIDILRDVSRLGDELAIAVRTERDELDAQVKLRIQELATKQAHPTAYETDPVLEPLRLALRTLGYTAAWAELLGQLKPIDANPEGEASP